MKKPQDYVDRCAQLFEERKNWDPFYQELSDYILPYQGFFDGQTPNQGDKRGTAILDPTATYSLRLLGAGMQGGLTPQSRPWFKLGLVDADMEEISGVREWLYRVEQVMSQAFARSNFYACAHQIYREQALYGTAVMYCEGSDTLGRHLRFRALNCGEYALAGNYDGDVDTVYRKFWVPARSAYAEFGDRLSENARKMGETSPYKLIEIMHAVQPREGYDPSKRDKMSFPFESVYLETAAPKTFLRESGYEELPYMVPRWDINASDWYGRSVGMDVLPDVKQMQAVRKDTTEAINKAVRPPMIVPKGYKGRLSLIPGALNISSGDQTDQIRPLLAVQYDIQAALLMIQDLRQSVQKGLFNDLFLMITERPNMTATEVAARQHEKLQILGPVIERQMTDFLNPLIERCFGILNRKINPNTGQPLIPAPPEEIQGQDLKVVYISMLAQAQQMVGTQAINAVLDFAARSAQLNPEVLDKFNLDEMADSYSQMVGVPPKTIRADEEVFEIRARRQQQMAQQQAAQEAMAATQGAKNLGTTPTGEDSPNALTDLMNLISGAA